MHAWQDLLASMLVMHLSPAAFFTLATNALQQSLVTEPVTRLLELLLYSRFILGRICFEVADMHAQSSTYRNHAGMTYCPPCGACAVVNKETSVNKVMRGHTHIYIICTYIYPYIDCTAHSRRLYADRDFACIHAQLTN